jgi:hypothetical protein
MLTLLDFYHVTLLSGLVDVGLITIVYCMHSAVGRLFFPGYKFFIQAFVGSSFSAAITASLCTFNAVGARYFVYLNLLSIALLNLYQFRKIFTDKNGYLYLISNRFKSHFQSLLLFLLSICFLIFNLIQQFTSTADDTITVNAHQSYFGGVPLEILQADYSSRLRILDNYPLEYPRFHFFRGAGVANLLPFINHPSYFEYQLGSICIMAGLVALVFESAKIQFVRIGYKPIIFGLFFSITLLANQLRWTIQENNLPSIAPVLSVLILANSKLLNKRLIFALLVIFSATTSRSFFPAVFMILVVIHSVFKVQDEIFFSKRTVREALSVIRKVKSFTYFTLVFAMTDLTMLTTGTSFFGLLHPKTWLVQPLYNLVPIDWLSLMSPSLSPANFQTQNSLLTTFKPHPIFFFLFCIIALMLVIRKRRVSLLLFFKGKLQIGLFISSLLFFLSSVFVYENRPEYLWFLCYYIVPISIVSGLFTGFRLRLVFAFIIASLGEFSIFIAGASVPNWILIEWFMILVVIQEILGLKKFLQLASIFPFIFAMFLFPDSFIKPNSFFELNPLDDKTRIISLDSYSKSIPNSNMELYCRGSDEEGLLWSLKGVRSTYKIDESRYFTVTADFGRLSSQDIEFIYLACNK